MDEKSEHRTYVPLHSDKTVDIDALCRTEQMADSYATTHEISREAFSAENREVADDGELVCITDSVATDSYWIKQYAGELQNILENSEYALEDWFEDQCDDIVEWLCQRLEDIDPSISTLLDLGCGNGSFLIKLRDSGFQNLTGYDYIPDAIEIARNGCKDLDVPVVELYVVDITKPKSDTDFNDICGKSILVGDKVNDRCSKRNRDCGCGKQIGIPEKTFDVINDKGTFDIFYMKHEVLEYVLAVCKYMHTGSILCITSCNATAAELQSCFVVCPTIHTDATLPLSEYHLRVETALNLNAEMSISSDAKLSGNSKKHFKDMFTVVDVLNHKTFEFAGVTGQVVASVAFKYNVV